MFAGLINQAKSAISGLVLKYVARASVAVPFVIGVAFALAAVTVMLINRFGYVMAYWLVAGGLAAFGVVATIVVSVREQQEDKAEQVAEDTDTGDVMSDATAQAAMQAPIALLGTVLSTAGGATSALSAARVLGRNVPLVLLVAMISALFWPTKQEDVSGGANVDMPRRPNGLDDLPSVMRH